MVTFADRMRSSSLLRRRVRNHSQQICKTCYKKFDVSSAPCRAVKLSKLSESEIAYEPPRGLGGAHPLILSFEFISLVKTTDAFPAICGFWLGENALYEKITAITLLNSIEISGKCPDQNICRPSQTPKPTELEEKYSICRKKYVSNKICKYCTSTCAFCLPYSALPRYPLNSLPLIDFTQPYPLRALMDYYSTNRLLQGNRLWGKSGFRVNLSLEELVLLRYI